MPERSRNSLEFYLLRLLSEKALAALFVEKYSIQMVESKSLYLLELATVVLVVRNLVVIKVLPLKQNLELLLRSNKNDVAKVVERKRPRLTGWYLDSHNRILAKFDTVNGERARAGLLPGLAVVPGSKRARLFASIVIVIVS